MNINSNSSKQKQKIFTTHQKKQKTTINISRKGSIVKERCQQLTEVALNLFPNRIIPDTDLTDLILLYIGGDKETVRAYKGYKGRLRRSKRTGEGYICGVSRKGYLEIFGFMHRLNREKWVIHTQASLFPNTSEECVKRYVGLESFSKEKISLSQSSGIESEVDDKGCNVGKINNNNTTEKERNFTPKIIGELKAKELAILRAEPCQEADRAKTNLKELPY
jgi:hypothetical protein